MPAGDGVSLPTTIAQLGTVAKTQAKGQHTPTPTTPFSEQVNKDEDLRVNRVKETDDTQHEKIDPQKDNPDKRKRRRLNRQRKKLDEEPEGTRDEPGGAGEPEDEERLGVLIDMRV